MEEISKKVDGKKGGELNKYISRIELAENIFGIEGLYPIPVLEYRERLGNSIPIEIHYAFYIKKK